MLRRHAYGPGYSGAVASIGSSCFEARGLSEDHGTGLPECHESPTPGAGHGIREELNARSVPLGLREEPDTWYQQGPKPVFERAGETVWGET